ncbi:1-(5-phosphoribosyl)-5-[(5-phosphoribosylamino)methylideneamino]imidazole-4-carboxamide isomerase [Gemmiger sp. An50]|uniref:1-(5-phosphoribosyl)-5-[(5- phosphoribosylamino)methylideneamino]imidazole-4- carboxamide isomerase n=1 Tax=Gemmiger sp. An50 TaxID=1965639 RepID=UPI000B3876C1|nr:1-(5-phosphoribosyl)-5-[(5-phosphoribosylamino)methylideneamino]imidazole-4-carboxamide isomerase [Gemmiger sp. An50]OUN83436.1 1-(5-phosphoribosyl)-5-[(5-phosphoribosylamino)methylideneamino]imidazole-4-carboxamide isomerase [Gemmiger sp. An50]
MILFPAIDLYEGQAVRLYQGDYRQMTVYSPDPAALARKFAATGATHIHLVDLEGARDGTTPNLQLIRRIAAETGLFVEVGGGIRNMDIARAYLENGVSRVILGTAAVTDPNFLQNALDTWGERVAVGADLRDGQVAIRGWQQTSDEGAQSFFDRMQGLGVSTMICTDISRDGAMRGANLELYRKLAKRQGLQIVASGGVSSLDDIKALRQMDLYGVILGKAYYTGAVDLADALEAAK